MTKDYSSILVKISRASKSFSNWIANYKNLFDACLKLFTFIVAALTLGFFVCQVNQINRQIILLSEQNKTIWYGFRPILVIKFKAETDIFLKPPSIGQLHDTKNDSIRYYDCRLLIENIGRSNATLDSLSFRYISEDKYTKDTSLFINFPVPPGQSIYYPFSSPIRISSTNIIKLILFYHWEEGKSEYEIEPEEYYYLIIFEDGKWKITLLTYSEYEDYALKYIK